jgi:hypothetical protein
MDAITYNAECFNRDKVPNLCVRHALELLQAALDAGNKEYLDLVDGTGGVVRTGDMPDHESDRMVKLSKRLGELDTAICKVKNALGAF